MQGTETNPMAARAAERAAQDERIQKAMSCIGRTLLVMSGKGGVGKSCVAVNIAAGLAARGKRVGLMDVDLHGPSIPQMLGMVPHPGPDTPAGILHRTMGFEDGYMIPAHVLPNLDAVSIECMLESVDSPVIWRGPMKIGAIRQFIADVRWGALDYLVIDSPPGTGDEPLTIAQTIPKAEAVIVTTPQKVSIRDVRKSIMFCRTLDLRIAGLVENMSGYACPSCGASHALFRTGGGKEAAQQLGVAFLGAIPIIPEVVDACDNGVAAISVSNVLAQHMQPILDRLEQQNA
jgi:ATP-binding protein involved in chromosome partitioning